MKEVEETDETDQVELGDLIQIRKDSAITMGMHRRVVIIIIGVVFSVRPLDGVRE